MLSVNKSEHGDLPAGHELFDDNAISGIAELLVHHQLTDPVLCGCQIFADQDALAQGKSGSFENDGERSCLKIGQRLVRVIEGLIGRGRNAVFFHQILGKSFASFDDSGVCGRAENTQSLCFKGVHNTCAERIVHAADSEIDLFLFCNSRQCCEIHGPDRNALGNTCNAGVAGSAIQLRHTAAAQDRIRDRMFSAASADEQYLHVHFLLCQVFFLLQKN